MPKTEPDPTPDQIRRVRRTWTRSDLAVAPQSVPGILLQQTNRASVTTIYLYGDLQIEESVIPEPTSLAIFGGLGIAGLVGGARRRRRACSVAQ